MAPTRAAAALSLLLAASLAPAARGETAAARARPIILTTVAGKWLRGEAVEIEPGDHVTVAGPREATVVPWDDVACVSHLGLLTGGGGEVLPRRRRGPPPPPAVVHFTSAGTGALDEARWAVATRLFQETTPQGEATGAVTVLECRLLTWRPLCRGDCTVEVPADRQLRVTAGGLPPGETHIFEPGSGPVTVRAGAPARPLALAGSVLIGAGATGLGGAALGVLPSLFGDHLGARRDSMLYALFWSSAALLGAGAALASLGSPSVRVTRPRDEAPPSLPGARSGVQLGVRLFEGFRFQGSRPNPTGDVKPDDGIRRHTAVEIELGYRLLPELYVGVLGSRGPAEVSCGAAPGCFGRVSRAGATVRGYVLSASGRWSFWGGLGARYEWTESRFAGRAGETTVAYRGPQLFFMEMGGEVAPAPRLFAGPFVRASFGRYDALGARTPEEGDRSGAVRHNPPLMFFDLGLRGSFTL